MIVPYIVIAIFVIIGLILLIGKGSWLIAGYNTANKEQKEKYNVKKLCRSMGVMFLLIAAMIGATCFVDTDEFALKMIVPMIIVVVVELFYANKCCYKK